MPGTMPSPQCPCTVQVRQTSAQCVERGRLLHQVWGESMAVVGGLVRMVRVARERQRQSQRKSDAELQQWTEACRALQACYTPLACTASHADAHVDAHIMQIVFLLS